MISPHRRRHRSPVLAAIMLRQSSPMPSSFPRCISSMISSGKRCIGRFQTETSGTTAVGTLNGRISSPQGCTSSSHSTGRNWTCRYTYSRVLVVQGRLRTRPAAAGGRTLHGHLSEYGQRQCAVEQRGFHGEVPGSRSGQSGPSMWASDPRFLDATLSVVGDNFLDIPDYYQYNSRCRSPDGPVPTPAAPDFWTVVELRARMPQFFRSSTSMPSRAMPTVNWNGRETRAVRRAGSVRSEPRSSRLPNALFATSNVATVTIQNPGPGGGVLPRFPG